MTVMTSEDLIREALSASPARESAKDGIKLKASKARTVDFADLKTRRRYNRELPEKVADWTATHFVIHAREAYKKRYGKDWGLNFVAQSQEIHKVRDSLVDVLGFVDNDLLRDYLDWFFENQSDGFLLRAKDFYFSQLRQDWVLEKFVKGYRISLEPTKPSPKKEIHVEKTVQENLFDDESMSCAFMLSDEDFVLEYGIVLSVCWLAARRGYPMKDALKLIYQACVKIDNKKQFEKIKAATERYNPYPPNALFLQADRLAKKVNPDYAIDVQTSSNALSSLRWLTAKV